MRIVDACGFLSLMRNCPAVPGQVKQVLSQFTERISVTRLSNFHFRESTVSVSLRHWLHRESDGTEVPMKRGMVASTLDYLLKVADRKGISFYTHTTFGLSTS